MPEFTAEERFLVSAMRGDGDGLDASHYTWTCLITSSVIAAFAAFYGNVWMMFSAFIVLVGTRVYEERWQARYRPSLRSIILKYEAAISESAPPQR
jgi:hypothetical protein